MRTLIFDGRLVKDAEVKVSASGTKYCTFTVASNGFKDGAETTDYIDVRTFNPSLTDKRSDFLKKGRYVIVTGAFEVEKKEKNGVTYVNQRVLADTVDFPRISSGNTRTEVTEAAAPAPVAAPVQQAPAYAQQVAAPVIPPVSVPSPSVAYAGVSAEPEEDLPF